MKLRDILIGAALLIAPAAASTDTSVDLNTDPTIDDMTKDEGVKVYYVFSPSVDGAPLYRQVVDKWAGAFGNYVDIIDLNCVASEGIESDAADICEDWFETDTFKGGQVIVAKPSKFYAADVACIDRGDCSRRRDLPAVYVDSDDGLVRVTNDAELCEEIGLDRSCLDIYFP